MKDETPDPKERLLSDVFRADADADWAYPAKQQALTAFRRARLWNRVAIVSRLAAAAAVLAGGTFFFSAQLAKNRSVPQPSREMAAQEVEAVSSAAAGPAPLPTLTDEELLASFPPHTCFLAEVDGRKILVFADSTLQKKYLH